MSSEYNLEGNGGRVILCYSQSFYNSFYNSMHENISRLLLHCCIEQRNFFWNTVRKNEIQDKFLKYL